MAICKDVGPPALAEPDVAVPKVSIPSLLLSSVYNRVVHLQRLTLKITTGAIGLSHVAGTLILHLGRVSAYIKGLYPSSRNRPAMTS